MNTIQRYLLEIVLIALVFICVVVYYHGKQHPKTDDYKAKFDSLELRIDSLGLIKDSATKIEQTFIKKISITNNYYDSIEKNIISLPDSIQFVLLRSNIDKYGSEDY